MIRVLVCDPSADSRARLRTLLAEQPEISVVGEAADGQEGTDLAVELWPDVVLVDAALPVMDGAATTREILRLVPDARIVARAGPGDRHALAAMVEAGASAACAKEAPLWELERAIAGAAEPLVGLAHALTRNASIRGAGELVAREITRLTGGASTAVYLGASDIGLSLLAAACCDAAGLSTAPGVVLESFHGRRLVLANRRERAELGARGLSCREAVAVPLVHDGETLGAVLVVMRLGVDLEIDHDLVATVAGLAAAAVANERRFTLTQAEARRDALTGLPNRRAFDERLDDVLDAGARVGLAVLDLDGLRRINHAQGHETGDDVLRKVARIASGRLRDDDGVYRIGGDELALLVGGGREAAELVARRLLRCLREHRRGLALPVVSAGVAGSPENGLTRAELLAAAEAALSAAKAEAGSRVATHRPRRDHVSISSERRGSPVVALPDRTPAAPGSPSASGPDRRTRVLVVDDDESLRRLLRTTLAMADLELDEAADVPAARRRIAKQEPDVVVLDVALPGPSGLALCKELKADPRTQDIAVVVLTGSGQDTQRVAQAAGADAYLGKPFSPLDLVGVVQDLAGGIYAGPVGASEHEQPGEQLLRYAEDLGRLLALERGQRALVQGAYRATIGALASALEAKDTGTKAHSQRVQRYALELARTVDPALLEEPSVEYGFLLHDVGKIGIPDRILEKPGALTAAERRVVETHTVLGEQMLSGVALLAGGGLEIVRSHHERWDGRGYPDGLAGYQIPLPARIFAVADALDAMTSDRPYRRALSWEQALAEIRAEAAKQFDPNVVEMLDEREEHLRAIYEGFAAGAEPATDRHAGDDEAWLPEDEGEPDGNSGDHERERGSRPGAAPDGSRFPLTGVAVAGAAAYAVVVVLLSWLLFG